MPPGILAAVQTFLPLIEKLLPILEKFFDMITGSNNDYSNSDKGKDATDKYLNTFNGEDGLLAKLNKAAAAEGHPELNLPTKIDTAEEADYAIDFFKALLAKEGGSMSVALKNELEETIKNLETASKELTSRGKVDDPKWDRPAVGPIVPSAIASATPGGVSISSLYGSGSSTSA